VEEKAEQLSLISKYKSEFLANMSHELRTPLNSLLILSKMLSENKEANMTGEQIKFANTIYSSGCDLLALINEILDLSKVEAGKMPIVPRDVKVPEICEYLEHTFRPVANHKNLSFQIETSPDIGGSVINTDVTRVQQILKNLLSNAFKFTEQGKVSMKIHHAMKKGEKVIVFAVTDTGIGIPKEKQNLIFEAFQQADGTTNRKYGGTGLGLTISRQISKLLGGAIEVESTPGVGSTFTLHLPLRYVPVDGAPADISEARVEMMATEEVKPTLPKDANFKEKKVLVIDDDMRNIFAITVILERQGMEVLYADNGRSGIEKLKENPDIDVVLMDVMMPEMGGLEATQEIRKMEQFKNLPIITLTAKAMKGDREKALEAGSSDYITKPVDTDVLLATMHKWIQETEALKV
jgi:CheY-like chemotaxis protein